MKNKFFLLIILVLSLILSSCAAFFQTKVPMVSGQSSATLEDLLVEKVKGGKLSTPSQIIISQNGDPSIIQLKWTAVPNAAFYRIEFASLSPDKNGEFPEKVPEELFNVLEKSWYSTNYVHNITSSTIEDYEDRYNKHYYYRITATNAREKYDESDPTDSSYYGTLLAPPTNVNATGGESEEHIKITWNNVKGATKYEIYRSENSTGVGAESIGTVYAEFGDTQCYKDVITASSDKGKEFYYSVYAINRDGVKSERSSFAMGYTLVQGAPQKPTEVQFVNGRGNNSKSISLKWKTVGGSDSNISYNVFRQSAKDTSIVKVGKDLKKGEFTDKKNLLPGTYYKYFIQTVVTTEVDGKKDFLKSAFSDPIEGFILSPPTDLQATKVDGSVQLSWTNAIGNEQEQQSYTYYIYTSNQLKGTYEEHHSTKDYPILVGKYNFYKIKTFNDLSGEFSDFSEIISPAPDAVETVKISQADYSFINDTIVPNESGVFPVKITWEKPSNDMPYGYNVYRSQKPDSGFRKISENLINDKLEYFDSDATLQPGRAYYYKILSVNSLEQGQNFSPVKYGWGALTHERYMKLFNETILSSQKKLTLMHKPGSTDKLGTESYNGNISGTVYYNAAVQGLGAYIVMKYTNYADNAILGLEGNIPVFVLTGNSDTSAKMDSSGNMIGTITCQGMYPGSVNYSNIKIVAGAAGGGTYGVKPEGYNLKEVTYTVLEN